MVLGIPSSCASFHVDDVRCQLDHKVHGLSHADVQVGDDYCPELISR